MMDCMAIISIMRYIDEGGYRARGLAVEDFTCAEYNYCLASYNGVLAGLANPYLPDRSC